MLGFWFFALVLHFYSVWVLFNFEQLSVLGYCHELLHPGRPGGNP